MLCWASTNAAGSRSTRSNRAVSLSQHDIWSAGDFSAIAASSILVGELLCESIPLRAGQRVLDVATGSGNTAMSAARRACDVVGVDFVPALLERARERVAAERLRNITFDLGDTEKLPFPDASFDVTLSTFGHMFAPDPDKAASEMARVTKPGGTVAFIAWTPDGMFSKIFALHDKYNPKGPGLEKCCAWGDDAFIRARFGPYAKSFRISRKDRIYRARTAAQWLGFMRQNLGPTILAFAGLDARADEELSREMISTMQSYNRSGDETLFVVADCTEAVIQLK
jgi:ubiquinone/menaquinone biosynthesis C-methylase UbiE